jgi:exopolyphosphatase/guanosine-5'-triphosphate,3'-diphosphate pyrophosphatase
LADSFDRAHDNKVKNISVKLSKKNLIIYVESIIPTYLEKWSFEVKSEFFEEVFGIKPDFRRVIK